MQQDKLPHPYRAAGSHEPLFPSRRAFVVQFARGGATASEPARGISWYGRVEHLDSGLVSRFASADALIAFMRDVLGGDDDTAQKEI